MTNKNFYGIILMLYAAVAELADAADSKSADGDIVPVQVRSAALFYGKSFKKLAFFCFQDRFE